MQLLTQPLEAHTPHRRGEAVWAWLEASVLVQRVASVQRQPPAPVEGDEAVAGGEEVALDGRGVEEDVGLGGHGAVAVVRVPAADGGREAVVGVRVGQGGGLGEGAGGQEHGLGKTGVVLVRGEGGHCLAVVEGSAGGGGGVGGSGADGGEAAGEGEAGGGAVGGGPCGCGEEALGEEAGGGEGEGGGGVECDVGGDVDDGEGGVGMGGGGGGGGDGLVQVAGEGFGGGGGDGGEGEGEAAGDGAAERVTRVEGGRGEVVRDCGGVGEEAGVEALQRAGGAVVGSGGGRRALQGQQQHCRQGEDVRRAHGGGRCDARGDGL